MKAVLLAGGEGRRMRPLTSMTPKPMLPVVGRPLMEHTLNLLARNGITEVIVAVQHMAAAIRDYFDDGSEFGVNITYATETIPMGTAGCVRMVAERLSDESFLVISADALADVDLAAFLAAHDEGSPALSMMLARRPDPREFGVAILDQDGRVTGLIEKPGWGDVVSDTVNTGIYCVDPSLLDLIDEDGPQDWAKDVIPTLLEQNLVVEGYITDGYWEDVGSLSAYLSAQHDVLIGLAGTPPDAFEMRPGMWIAEGAEIHSDAELVSPCYIGSFSRIDAGAVIGPDSVVESNVVVRRMAKVERSVLMDGCWLDVGADLRGSIVGHRAQVLRGARADDGAVLGDESVLGEESHLVGDVLIYPGKSVDAGVVVRDSLVWESKSRKHLFGPRGVSGLVNIEVTADLAVRLGSAFASTLPKGSVVTVGRDHSRAARAFNRAVIGALTAGGMQVRDLRSAAVPIVRSDTANNSNGGIVMRTTAGHPESIDLVVLDNSGTDIGTTDIRRIERAIARGEFRRPPANEIGDIVVPHRVAEDFANEVVSRVDIGGLDEPGLRVVLDTAGGTATLVLPTLLSRLDIDVLTVNNRVDELRPTETDSERHLALCRLAGLVASSRSDFGIRIDPAGERMHIVDELGHIVTDDRAALIITDLVAAEAREGAVVLPLITTRLAEQVAGFHGVEIIRTLPDESELSLAVLRSQAILGADGRGGFIVPAMGAHLDPFAALVQLLGLVSRTRLTLSAIDSRIPRSYVAHSDIVTPWGRKGKVMRIIAEAAQQQIGESTVQGGVMIEPSADSWVFVQPHPTEAITRVWAESVTTEASESLLDRWVEVAGGGLD